jgi:hypothetical protein
LGQCSSKTADIKSGFLEVLKFPRGKADPDGIVDVDLTSGLSADGFSHGRLRFRASVTPGLPLAPWVRHSQQVHLSLGLDFSGGHGFSGFLEVLKFPRGEADPDGIVDVDLTSGLSADGFNKSICRWDWTSQAAMGKTIRR